MSLPYTEKNFKLYQSFCSHLTKNDIFGHYASTAVETFIFQAIFDRCKHARFRFGECNEHSFNKEYCECPSNWCPLKSSVITSYSIHYTKLYESFR